MKGWNAVINTNLNGTWYMMQATALRWRDSGQPGTIVNVTATIRARPAAYGAFDRGPRRRDLPVEDDGSGMGSADYPGALYGAGAVESSGFAWYSEEGRKTFSESNPMRRAGDVWDVTDGCAHLASPAGEFITGEVLTIYGSQQMWGDFQSVGRPDNSRSPERRPRAPRWVRQQGRKR